MRAVNVTACPEDFRIAWIDVIHAVENYKPVSNLQHGATAAATGYAATKSGSRELGDVTAREIEEVTTSDDVKLAVQKLETVAMKYDVQFSKVRPAQSVEAH